MSNLDDLLQQSLTDIENGHSKEEVLARLPEEAAEVIPLIQLAAAVRAMPHPQPDLLRIRATQANLSATFQAGSRKMPQTSPNSFWARFKWLLIPGFATATVAFMLVCIGVIALGNWLGGPANAQRAKLIAVSGRVEVNSITSTDDTWDVLSEGDVVRTGQRIRTVNDSSVTLLYFDGSRTQLGPNTEIALAKVDGNWGGVLSVEIEQIAGFTSHNIVPLRGKGFFTVQTSSGSATVHGTTFDVLVPASGQARFAVTTGSVVVSNAQAEVTLDPGQATWVEVGLAPQMPGYQFTIQDQLASSQDGTWSAGGVNFQVTEQTALAGNPAPGGTVLIQGRVLPSGEWVADNIQPAKEKDKHASFTGIVESITGETWQIGGQAILVNDATEVEGEPVIGEAVEVKYALLTDGRWLALSLEALEAGEATPTPAGSVTPEITSTPVTNCVGSNPHPKGQALAESYGVPYEEIMGWFCQGFGFGEIDLAYSLSEETGHSVTDIFALRRQGLGWGEIRKLLTGATPTPTLTPTVPLTLTVTPTITATIVPSLTATPTPASTLVTNCTGANPHPKGQELAETYGVPYEEIMGWFCQGFGFGEIDLAYSLSQESGKPVAEIFAMKQSGLGWGEIKKLLDEGGKEKKKDKDKGGK